MSLEFDERGYLKPYGIVNITLDEFIAFFVDAFPATSSRHSIFQRYRQYLEEISAQVNGSFEQWINGSFVTDKENPKDIDFVTFIDHTIFAHKENLIEEQFRLEGARRRYNLDAYTVRVYPEDHPKHTIFEGESAYWTNWFGQTKKNRAKMKFKKGFVRIYFQDFQNIT